MYNLEHRAIFSFDSLSLNINWTKPKKIGWELNAKQACTLTFTVYNKIHIVAIFVDINLLIQCTFTICIQDYS